MEYCITVTFDCNWNCDYCVINTHNAHIADMSNINDIDKIKNGSHVNISGGEPGLVSEELLLEIIKKLREKSCFIQINSNGTIFRMPKVVEKVDHVFYHCTKDFDINDKINRDFKHITSYMAVVSNKNWEKVDAFLEKNEDLKLILFAARDHLKKSIGIKLYQKYKDVFPLYRIQHLIDPKCGYNIIVV
jgi:organic radical activating enzyme